MDRQKLLLIFGGAWVSAALLTWLLYSATTSAKQAKLIKVQAAARDLSAGTKLRKGDLRLVEIPEKEQPRGVFADEKALLEKTLLFPVAQNEPLTQMKLAAVGGIEGVSATIPPGKRAISIQVTDSTSAAGLILPRSHVDVVFTRTGSMAEALSKVILEDIVVLSVGRTTEVATTDPKAAAAAAAAQAQSSTAQRAMTLLVTPEEAAKLELAKNNGKIGLVLRNPLDASKLNQEQPIYADTLDPYLGARKERMAKFNPNLPGMAKTVNDDKSWNNLTGQKPAVKTEKKETEPPKPPQKVVDVFRGDKHVQEVFEKVK
ncbi:MAG: Flp pilus assembly protein CpaB [Acidobacteria bacterium]|nr:Flp pilus assembly protein CpaB [Acidobacteriota bacterium]